MKAVVATLLVAAVFSLATADYRFRWVESGCFHDFKVYEVGETFIKGCDTCTCHEDGKKHIERTK